ncbi:helix-turn-helix domain-containing protein [Kineococcus rhizosphaerae]|uniref:IclR-like helix-turn-helix domain-containing protein n=1 Tax=Kineococcus rhizosphaerae TaxID=559628 RepID=A0A2T0QTM0_9ACTN|nr:helix-turn-helix domain-containing protein [Kineococcus rhizosphaerae]PRY08414.1 IclR-like helix-turn-helix domain-containing protein [Kineococcus rhizosphaerae]
MIATETDPAATVAADFTAVGRGSSIEWCAEALRLTGGGDAGNFALWLDYQFRLADTDVLVMGKAEMAQHVGYSRPTVMRLMAALVDLGLIVGLGKQDKTPSWTRCFPAPCSAG